MVRRILPAGAAVLMTLALGGCYAYPAGYPAYAYNGGYAAPGYVAPAYVAPGYYGAAGPAVIIGGGGCCWGGWHGGWGGGWHR